MWAGYTVTRHCDVKFLPLNMATRLRLPTSVGGAILAAFVEESVTS